MGYPINIALPIVVSNMSRNRDISIDRRYTKKILAGASPKDFDFKERNWLGHRLGSGAAQIDEMLIRGATADALQSVRPSYLMHLYHLDCDHGLMIRKEKGKYSFARL